MARPDLAAYQTRFADWIRTRSAIFAAVLLPLIIAVPLRALWFPDTTDAAILLLGPATEESVKMAGAIATLIVFAMILPPVVARVGALRRRLFWIPWIVGGLYGAYESLVQYGQEAAYVTLIRIAEHAALTALGFSSSLYLWGRGIRALAGAACGLGLAILAHDIFNAFVVFGRFTANGFAEQLAYSIVVVGFALGLSIRVTQLEPSSSVAAEFLLPFTGRERA